jgi:PAS domain S-box-containing protein
MGKLLRILQVEDSESDAAFIIRVLKRAGFQVEAQRVEDAETMRMALASNEWDVIIADHRLPQFDAPGALAILRKTGIDIPFIVVSGVIGEDAAIEMMRAGAHDYLIKGDLARLAPVVEREVNQARSRQQRRLAEEAKRESDERFAAAIDAAKVGVFDFYPQIGKRIWSERCKRHFGLSPDAEVTYDTFLRGLHPEDLDVVHKSVQDALRPESSGHYAAEYRTVGIEDSVERWLAVRGHVFFDDDHRPSRFVGTTLDISERKKAEQARLESEARERARAMEVEAVMNAVPAITFIARSPDCLHMTGSRATYELLGMPEGSNLSKSAAHGEASPGYRILQDGKEVDPQELPMQKAGATGQPVRDWECALERHNGPSRILLGNAVPMLDEAGHARGAVGVFIDITERKQAEQALRAVHEELATIYANAPVALFLVDDNLRVQKLNERAAQLSGQQPARISGQRIGEAIGCLKALESPAGCGHGISCKECPIRRAALDTLHSGTLHESIETAVPMAVDGHIQQRSLLVSSAPIQLGRTKKALVCAQDVTPLRRVEAELAQQREMLERQAKLINLAHDAIITLDANRVIHAWNKGAEEMYGWPEEKVLGTAMSGILRTGGTSTDEIDDILEREGRWDGELTYSRRDGRKIIAESRQVLLRDASGAAAGILEIDRDITGRRQAERALRTTVRQLESALAEKTVLLKEVHHRVKNNLAVISSLLGMKADATANADVRLALEQSQQRVMSIALIHQHLYGTDHLDRINFAIYATQLIQELHSAFVSDAERISIQMDIQPIELGIHCAVPCALILNELVSNAFKHAFPDQRRGVVGISFRECKPGQVELAIEDDGIGAPGGFEAPDSKSLGLRIVRILTRQLGGELKSESGSRTRLVLRFSSDSSMRVAESMPDRNTD